MKDVVYLSVGDLRVPFVEYEGDTRAYCRGIIAAFNYLGVDSDITEMVTESLSHKPQRVQKVFLLRIAGVKQDEIAKMTGVTQPTVSRDISQRCGDIRDYLRSRVKPSVIASYQLPERWPGDQWHN